MAKKRLYQQMVARGLAATRSQADSLIKMGGVKVDGKEVAKTDYLVEYSSVVKLSMPEKYVSRAAYKLASVASAFKLDFRDKVVLDVGSSTGGFTDYALKKGAKKVIAVDVGTNQLHP